MPTASCRTTRSDARARPARKPQAIPFLKRFTVFNAAQCENLPDEVAAVAPPPPPGLIEPRVEALIRATGIDFRIGGNRAFYAPAHGLSCRSRRRKPISSRSTGTARPCTSSVTPAAHPPVSTAISPASFGTKKYAFEELVAEMNAAFCCASLGIVPTVRHADYIGSWLEVLREDNRAIVRAASQASKAADWLLGFLPDDDDEPLPQPAPCTTRVNGRCGRGTRADPEKPDGAPVRAFRLRRLCGAVLRGRGLRRFS